MHESGVKYNERSIQRVTWHYFIGTRTRDVNDASYYVWIRGVAWPSVSHRDLICVRLLVIDDYVKQSSQYFHELYNNNKNVSSTIYGCAIDVYCVALCERVKMAGAKKSR